ncbi:hypothetical protein OIU84_016007 [Salix udensis]|uniref:Uncharacterized protein n=1 Tax=Salix udensis TaxID=889485 RepID=A0AAD6J8X9_9ROSI|nr:hypothetical protein OIU84_016007 [Salix udensis]
MSLLTRLSGQKRFFFMRHLSSSTASSKLHDIYCFKPPPSLSPEKPQASNNNNNKKKQKPEYRPPSSLETNKKPLRSDLPFDFRFSYTESSPDARPIGLREPKYSPFGPGRLDRTWTGVCAPAVDLKVKSVDVGVGEEGADLEEKRTAIREKIQGKPLTKAERRILAEKCQRNKTKRQINLGMSCFCFLVVLFLFYKVLIFFGLTVAIFVFRVWGFEGFDLYVAVSGDFDERCLAGWYMVVFLDCLIPLVNPVY